MILFVTPLPVTRLLLLYISARLSILLVLETTTLALIVSSSRWRLVKVKDALGLIQELQVRGTCCRRRRESLDSPILLEVVLLD